MIGDGLIRFFALRAEAKRLAALRRKEREREARMIWGGFRREYHVPSGERYYVGGHQSGFWTVLKDGTMQRHLGAPPKREWIDVFRPLKVSEYLASSETVVELRKAIVWERRVLIPVENAEGDFAYRDVTIFLESPPTR